MKYISTRNSSKEYSFEHIFFKSLSEDGGLFLPKEFPVLNSIQLEKFKGLTFQQMSFEIFKIFTGSLFSDSALSGIINKAYSNFKSKDVIGSKKIGPIHFVELYHGPTLAFKDIAMQVLGLMYEHLLEKKNDFTTLVTATSGDTGAAAIDAFKNKKNVKLFVLHPYNKISEIQRKFMTTVPAKNIFNIAIQGTFDDCQNLVKEMFVDKPFANKINMSGVNSINWARIIAQTVYYFYIYFKFNPKQQPIIVSVPTGNFGDVYAGYVAKKMGLPIQKLIVATNQNNILERCILKGSYEPSQVHESLSPSMDIQVASNFERILFEITGGSSEKVSKYMMELKNKGNFKLDSDQLKNLQKNFDVSSCEDKEIIEIIKKIYSDSNEIIDPHTATATKPLLSYKTINNIYCLETAHASKFPAAIKKALGIEAKLPDSYHHILKAKEKLEIMDNDIEVIKKFILSKVTSE